ncbi:FtsQ-type POTRA domain-containing protein [Nocardioides sp. CN2-186]|uniref:cell division protein FtsQ/DivIB n=1 Tax=Nocardioides tweenelious TaxID=3156607 RepID=UPI0032B512C6
MARRDTAERSRRRFARRQWARRWITWKPVVAVLLVLALVVGGLWLVYFSSYLSVQGVQVTGVHQLTASEVRSAAAVPDGDSLATLDLNRIRTRVEAMAPVQSADVSRQWPDQVLIEVQERQAIAVVDIGGTLHGMDAEGVVFVDYDKAPAGLPRVETTADTGTDALREGALVVAALPTELAAKVDHVDVATVDEISLVLRDGREVVWGSADQSELKAEVLASLLGHKAQKFDVSVPGTPTTSG